MAEEDRIFEGTYKQFPIYWKSSTTEGGRSLVVRQFPNRDTQNVEDTGLIPRKFSLKLCVFAAQGFGYFEYRDALIATLESRGAGVFIHPLYGRVENVWSGAYSIQEEYAKFGDTVISVTFEVSNNTGIPKSAGRKPHEVKAAVGVLLDLAALEFADAWAVNPTSTGNFADATAKVEEFATAAEESIEVYGGESSFLAEFQDKITSYGSAITENVANGAALINDTLDFMQSAYNFYEADPWTQLSVISSFFGFGAGDTAIIQNTIGRIERFINRNIMNNSVNAAALGLAYQAASNISYDTVADVEYVRTLLDDQYALVRDSDTSKTIKDAVSNARNLALDILAQLQLNASQVVTIDTPETSLRLLAFNYYDDEGEAERLAKLNSISDPSVVVGDVDILTS